MTQETKIPFNRPSIVGKEFDYIRQAVSASHISGDGPFTKRCQQLLEETLGVSRAFLTTSCTHALEMAALLLDINPGDEVIVPSFTFVSTVNAFILRGAKPVFIDIRPDTLNMDESQLEALISPKTKAIVPVHYAGVGCEMEAICRIASQHGVPVVEDNAQGLFGQYKKRYLGTFGVLATQSFHESKNLTCGEGGALLINEEQYVERAEIIREKGTDRTQFLRGQVDKYTWRDVGSSYLPSDLLAAFLFAQLEARESIQAARKRIWEIYWEELQDWAQEKQVQLPRVPSYCEQTFHMFYLLLPSLEKRSEFIGFLKERGIRCVFHYQPLHLAPMGRRWGCQAGDFPVTEDISDRLVRLPFYNELSPADQERVCEAVREAGQAW